MEQATRGLETQALRGKLEVLATGGLYLSVVGVIWIALGIMMTSAPEELASLVPCLAARLPIGILDL
jgi:hypothetical protein